MVSGPRTSFDVSPVIHGGTEAEISIKENSSKLFHFGLFSREDVLRDDAVQANMFDAREFDGGKKIQIWRSEDGQIGASMTLPGRPDPQPLTSTGTKDYRDQDRIVRKDWLGWGIKIVSNTARVVGQICNAVSA